MSDDPTWLEILVRMCAGEQAEPPTEGILAVSLDEDSETLTRFHVLKHGPRWRAEDESGRPRIIDDGRYAFTFDEEDDTPARVDRTTGMRPSGDVDIALARREPWDWSTNDDDFTRPTGPPRRATFLGRDAWEVTLAPPAHKEGDLVMVVDAVDGRVLEQRNTVHGTFLRWEELRVVEPFDDDVFAWDGPFSTWYAYTGDDVPEELREEHERSEREGAALLVSLGLEDLAVTTRGEAHAHVDADGEASVSWFAQGGFRLERRPGGTPADPDVEDAPTATWVHGPWRWHLTVREMDETSATDLTALLRERTRTVSGPGGP